MSDVTIYEAGLMIGGKFSSFIESRKESDVDEYIEIMKTTKPVNSEIVKHKKLYRCISCSVMV
jgi:predicted hydrocarbon binding protein